MIKDQLAGKKILLGVTGCIAAYKSCFIVRELIKRGSEVKVVLTPSATEFIPPLWFKPWEKVLDDSNKPFFKWFVGAKTNIVHNAIDRHLKTHRKNQLALIWESEDGKIDRTFSYYSMNREVSRFANIIKSMGVQKGERVTIYMGRIPEIVFAMMACAKIGEIHSVVFGGFSVDSLQGRIDDSQSKLVITCDGSYQNGKIVELKNMVDDAIKKCPSVENVIVVKRTGQPVQMEAGRDHWYHDSRRAARPNRPRRCWSSTGWCSANGPP